MSFWQPNPALLRHLWKKWVTKEAMFLLFVGYTVKTLPMFFCSVLLTLYLKKSTEKTCRDLTERDMFFKRRNSNDDDNNQQPTTNSQQPQQQQKQDMNRSPVNSLNRFSLPSQLSMLRVAKPSKTPSNPQCTLRHTSFVVDFDGKTHHPSALFLTNLKFPFGSYFTWEFVAWMSSKFAIRQIFVKLDWGS